jgi:hypothetical protein
MFDSYDNKKVVDFLHQYCRTAWHSSFDLENGDVSIMFDDNRISLYFEKNELVNSFVAKHNLKINMTEFDLQVKILEDKLNNLLSLKKRVDG